jgi:hypothetical protein
MPLRRTTAKRNKSQLSPEVKQYLIDGIIPDSIEDEWLFFSLSTDMEALRDVWEEVKDEVLKEWIGDYPGTRPWCWWRFEAKEQRARVGGRGDALQDKLNYKPQFSFGVPVGWVNDWQVSYYNGRSKNIYGEAIGTKYKEGDFVADAYSEDDPPQYESEASYLRRHRLLTESETKILSKRRNVWEAVTV